MSPGDAEIADFVEIRLPADSAYLSVLRTATAGLAARVGGGVGRRAGAGVPGAGGGGGPGAGHRAAPARGAGAAGATDGPGAGPEVAPAPAPAAARPARSSRLSVDRERTRELFHQ